MKTILGLDLGTTSIGWALVKEGEKSQIIKTGVRVIPLSTDEISNFDKGKSITTNADRTLKRSMRRNLQRYKLRRENLVETLLEHGIISKESKLNESSNHSTFETYALRAKAAKERIELPEFARVLLMLNKKRGYKSSRKAKNDEDGVAIDGMTIAKELYDNGITPGQYSLNLLENGKKALPDFYRSDLQNEFNQIWQFQGKFYPEDLTDQRKEHLYGKTKNQTKSIFEKEWKIDAVELDGKMAEKKLKSYQLRAKSVKEQISLAELVEVFADINGNISNSSGYLGAISDRSKELFFTKKTIGEYLYDQIISSPHTRLKGQVFYRQDYLDEFNSIWETQAKFHNCLDEELKIEIRDIVIFYQRRLKSQKGLLSTCELEGKWRTVKVDGKEKQKLTGPKVVPKSSPIYQEFRTWTQLCNLEIFDLSGKNKIRRLDLDELNILQNELQYKEKITENDINKILGLKNKYNFEKIDGNRTGYALIKAFQEICTVSGHDSIEWGKLKSEQVIDNLKSIFKLLGIHLNLLDFSMTSGSIEDSLYFKLWHLLYSYEGDSSKNGIESLIEKLERDFGLTKEYATILSNVSFESDYGSLSTKAIKKLLPHLREGNTYDIACALEGYNHSNSHTKEENEKRQLKDKLDILPKNGLRNPVVEKIINQMINVVNTIIDTYGKPDEVRVEMARELKKSAAQREKLTQAISKATREHEEIVKILRNEFGITNVTRKDIIRYKLYDELKDNGYRTLYSNTYISREMLFSAEIDIEHIIPQSKLFDDSFSNKTLEFRQINIKKGNSTAWDFVANEYGQEALLQYEERVTKLFNKEGKRSKYKKLTWEEKNIPDDFINRDLQDTQYIAKKAKELLEDVFRTVSTTTGSITDRLRNDWQLVDVMKELNLPKYEAIGMVDTVGTKNGHPKKEIRDWTKRNDHRHHAMDAITVAFTKPSFIQYLNNMNAKSDKDGVIYGILKKETYFDQDNKRRFKPPMKLDDFRASVKEHLENTLVSFKAKNKVTTRNKNKIQSKGTKITHISETPRGQLHKETVYGASDVFRSKMEKVGASFDAQKIATVAKPVYRNALLKRLEAYGNDPKKAFTGKNTLEKNPIYLNDLHTMQVPESVKIVWTEKQFTIRKPISPDLKLDKVVDAGARRCLQERLDLYGGDAKKAFTNLEENPIYLNKDKGIVLKSVTITGVSNAVALHSKKDHFGKNILNKDRQPIPTDFVSTGNNHHVAIYRDENGNLQEEVVSFMEAVSRKNLGLPIIQKNHPEDWEFLFTMKQNEYFVFPNEKTGFDPNAIDLMDPKNYKLISPNLFRVQTLSIVKYGNNVIREFKFRHHLETILNDRKELQNLVYKQIKSLNPLTEIIKVRINHIGQIVQTGEY
jgi:CRISPR-associated endonuclease Csn1